MQRLLGVEAFKGNQRSAIESVAAGRDTFVISTTGSGKTNIGALPALLAAEFAAGQRVAIMISPTLSLAADLVRRLNALPGRDGDAKAIALNFSGDLTAVQRAVLHDKCLSCAYPIGLRALFWWCAHLRCR